MKKKNLMRLVGTVCLAPYKKKQRFTLSKHLKQLAAMRLKASPVFSASSVYSSLIEGSGIDMDSYLYNKQTGYKNREMKQIDDLTEAYQFAHDHALTLPNLLKAHKILSRNFSMDSRYKGKVRDKEVRVGNIFRTVYRGAETTLVKAETKTLLEEISLLKTRKMPPDDCFYYAALIHLVFVKIHPFADGNGRAARLLEKWFLSKHIGTVAWSLPSEINYYLKRGKYYQTLRIGETYQTVDYTQAVPFLLLLPSCFALGKKYYSAL